MSTTTMEAATTTGMLPYPLTAGIRSPRGTSTAAALAAASAPADIEGGPGGCGGRAHGGGGGGGIPLGGVPSAGGGPLTQHCTKLTSSMSTSKEALQHTPMQPSLSWMISSMAVIQKHFRT